jgi:hypothetical protein
VEDEVVVAFTALRSELATVISVIRESHPYETPGIDVFDLVRYTEDGLL